MKSGRRAPDGALVGTLFEKRQQRIAGSVRPVDTVHLLNALVSDFEGLRDVSIEANRAKELSKQSEVKKALSRERAADDAEARELTEILGLEATLGDANRRDVALMALRDRLSRLARKANGSDESPERSQARRVLRGITVGASVRVQDRDYRALLDPYGLRGR